MTRLAAFLQRLDTWLAPFFAKPARDAGWPIAQGVENGYDCCRCCSLLCVDLHRSPCLNESCKGAS